MELSNFIKSLKRYRLMLILVPVLTAIASAIIVRYMPEKFTSRARLSAAAADKSQQLVGDNLQQESKVTQEFDNLLQTLTLNKITDRVSYKLILHDLKGDNPFRKLSPALSPAEKQNAISKFSAYYDERKSLNLSNPEEKALYKLLKEMKYDDGSLRKKLIAFRMDNSEYLNLEYSSENPQLSAFVLNTLAEEFVGYYSSVNASNKNRSLQFLDSLLREKQDSLAAYMEGLKQYKIANGILNADDQAKTIYGEIADIETKKGNAEKDMVAYSVALKNIDSRFSPENRKYLESSTSAINSEIVNTKEQIKAANEAYIKSGFNESYKGHIDSLQKKLTKQIYAQTDNYATNPSATKDNLVAQKLNMEVSRDLAQNSVHSLDNELGNLKGQLQRLVPGLANIQAYQAKIEVANKEYADALQKYNQARLEANNTAPVRIVELAMPGEHAPNKKIMLVAFSSIASLVLCLFILFVMFYFDDSVRTVDQLDAALNMPVLGSLNRIHGEFMNLQDLWNEKVTDANSRLFKNSLRSIRHELEPDLHGGNVLAVTSLREGEGKTFLTISLAYALSKSRKKVLIIDGNFMNPEISTTLKVPDYLENYLGGGGLAADIDESLSVIGNSGGDSSLLELSNDLEIKDFLASLKSVYDVILVETSAFGSQNKANAREWINYADKVVVVFESGGVISKDAAQDAQYLRQLNGKMAGVVLNKVASIPAIESTSIHRRIGQPATGQKAQAS